MWLQGISENIRVAYAFIAKNYQPGDEIILIGFSRGAFTARSIAGFISAVGLLTSKAMVDFYPIFLDWENQVNPEFKQIPAKIFNHRPVYKKFTAKEYVDALASAGLTRPIVPIKAVAVWDTVGKCCTKPVTIKV